MARAAAIRRRTSDLAAAMAECRSILTVMVAFSFAINVLMLASPLYMLQIYDRVLVSGHVETLIMLTGMAAGALLILAILDSLRSKVMVRMGCWLNDRLGPVLLASGVRSRLAGDPSGAQALRDLSQIQTFISSQGLIMFFDAPWTPLYLILIWLLHPLLGIVALVSAIVLLALSILNEVTTRKSTMTSNLAQIAAQHQAEATVRNAEAVRAMGMLPGLVDRWHSSNDAALRALQASAERGGIYVGATKFLRLFVQSATLGLGAYLVLKGEASGGVMIAASILLGRALAPIEAAMSSWRNFSTARISYSRIKNRLMAMPPEAERTRLPEPKGYIVLDKVSFALAELKNPILDRISLRLRPGEAVAVVGPSAGGKSTLCRILAGVIQPTSGEIRLDGSELFHWPAEQLGRFVGYLPQDVELFPGSIRDNIARMGETDDEKVVEAAMLAHAHEVIQHLPQGYETMVGDAGNRLSGGQRQRIGLARAVYGNSKIVILDEPNANLDQAGEAALAAAIARLKHRGVTLVIVGHRPSTLACADKILLLKDGRMEFFGERDEVLKRLRVAANISINPAAASTPDEPKPESLKDAKTEPPGADRTEPTLLARTQ